MLSFLAPAVPRLTRLRYTLDSYSLSPMYSTILGHSEMMSCFFLRSLYLFLLLLSPSSNLVLPCSGLLFFIFCFDVTLFGFFLVTPFGLGRFSLYSNPLHH